jgi:hypothetical protein
MVGADGLDQRLEQAFSDLRFASRNVEPKPDDGVGQFSDLWSACRLLTEEMQQQA